MILEIQRFWSDGTPENELEGNITGKLMTCSTFKITDYTCSCYICKCVHVYHVHTVYHDEYVDRASNILVWENYHIISSRE